MKITKTRDVKTPERGTERSAGIDFFIPNDIYKNEHTIAPGDHVLIRSGIHADIPRGFALIAMNKSGVALNKSLQVSAGVVDEDYQGEIHLHVINIGDQPCTISAGEKLLQMLLIPVNYDNIEVVDSLDELYRDSETERGTGNFGSTGTK